MVCIENIVAKEQVICVAANRGYNWETQEETGQNCFNVFLKELYLVPWFLTFFFIIYFVSYLKAI